MVWYQLKISDSVWFQHFLNDQGSELYWLSYSFKWCSSCSPVADMLGLLKTLEFRRLNQSFGQPSIKKRLQKRWLNAHFGQAAQLFMLVLIFFAAFGFTVCPRNTLLQTLLHWSAVLENMRWLKTWCNCCEIHQRHLRLWHLSQVIRGD